jgi:hypothetical protein
MHVMLLRLEGPSFFVNLSDFPLNRDGAAVNNITSIRRVPIVSAGLENHGSISGEGSGSSARHCTKIRSGIGLTS